MPQSLKGAVDTAEVDQDDKRAITEEMQKNRGKYCSVFIYVWRLRYIDCAINSNIEVSTAVCLCLVRIH